MNSGLKRQVAVECGEGARSSGRNPTPQHKLYFDNAVGLTVPDLFQERRRGPGWASSHRRYGLFPRVGVKPYAIWGALSRCSDLRRSKTKSEPARMSASAKPPVAPMPASPQSNPLDLAEVCSFTMLRPATMLGPVLVAVAMRFLAWDVLT